MAFAARPSPDASDTRPSWGSTRIILLVWLPIAAIGALHYGTGTHHAWVHDVLRRMYYLPIVLAAFQRGLAGGLVAAVVVSVTYLPHAFIHPTHFDPGRGIEKALEIVIYHMVGGISGYLADQERRRRLEVKAALEEQQRLLRQLVRAGRLSALGQVVAGMAHEIKNPLHALAGTAEVVDPLIPLEADERRLWELHRAEISRLERVAERFLSFGKPSPPRMEPIDLREVSRRLHDLVAAAARQRRVELDLALPEAPILVSGDVDQLAQVGMNIVVNAFRALGDRGGWIHLATRVESTSDRQVGVMVIENNGPAIPEALLEHIFDPFQTGDEGGTGLGLSISERIAEQHGGFLEVANTDQGVRFRLVLPLAEATGDRPVSEPSRSS